MARLEIERTGPFGLGTVSKRAIDLDTNDIFPLPEAGWTGSQGPFVATDSNRIQIQSRGTHPFFHGRLVDQPISNAIKVEDLKKKGIKMPLLIGDLRITVAE